MLRKRPALRTLKVIRKQQVTPNMLRITLGGSDMKDFPSGQESANCKLLFPSLGKKPDVRTYTIRKFNSDTMEVDIDFVLHRDHGPASAWAVSAKSGDSLGFRGPGGPQWVNFDADWFFLAGDMSALPAISANIERLPRDATGYAVLEIIDDQDRQKLDFPSEIEVDWVLNENPNIPNSVLFDQALAKAWLPGSAAVWVAGESGTTQKLRRYFKQDRDVAKENIYISGYWQIGLTEDAHQKVKPRATD